MQSAERAESRALRVASGLGVEVESIRSIARGRHALLEVSGSVEQSLARDLIGQWDWLRGVEPDMLRRPASLPDDPFFANQWHLDNTGQVVPGLGPGTVGADANVLEAWATTTGSRDVIVAVIDTGVDIDHPDLQANIWRNPDEVVNGLDSDGNGFVDDLNGWDFGENNNDPRDAQGHGTQVAGVIGAAGNNAVGVTGVAWNVSILPLKIADRFGNLVSSAIVGAHDYATMMRERGHNIVASNNSYGGYAPEFFEETPGFLAEREAIERFIASGAVFIAAAGNDGIDIDTSDPGDVTAYPAAYDIPGLVAVAATDNNDALAGFSNRGVETVDLAAPGVQLLTTNTGGGYTYATGTSFAAPMVAGVVALLKTAYPDASPELIRRVLRDSADVLPTLQGQVLSGGRLNAGEAMRILALEGPVLISAQPGPVTGQLDTQGERVSGATLTFNKQIDGQFLSTGGVSLVGAGPDGQFGTGDDFVVPIESVELRPDGQSVRAEFDLTGFSQQRLPLGQYRLTLEAGAFRDTDGNFLNGNDTGGTDEVYAFRVVPLSGTFEPNDTLATAEPVVFTASGSATFRGARIGDGLHGALDVDLYRLDLPRGGLIRAEVVARRLAVPSNLDSYLRLFDAQGNELSSNDEFFGPDALIDYFVPTGGTYYVGVSGFPNDAYNPTVAASGVSQSTGVYDLLLDVELIQPTRVQFERDLSDNPLRIPPQGTQGTVSDTLVVTDTRDVTDVNVRLDIAHDFVSDLRISLIGPTGIEVLLFNRRGGGGSDLDGTLFTDESSVPISQGAAPFDRAGGYRPEQPLGAFDGLAANGSWTLVIQDVAPLNAGFLFGWELDLRLESDIFGPFEFNDTLAGASVLPIQGTGQSSLQAFLGDGAFGALDVDLFRFEAEGGATLDAQVSSGGTLNSALRLFDTDGNELKLASPSGSLNASINNFVFPDGGTYYLGVSASSNTGYDPSSAASGSTSATTGSYTLTVSVAPGVSDQSVALPGEVLSAGAARDGTFFAEGPDGPTGLRFNGVEFLFDADTPSLPTHLYGASADGFTFRNDGSAGAAGLPVTLTDQSDAGNRRMVADGVFRGLSLERSVASEVGDGFLAFDVTLRNTTAQAVRDVTWMEAMNPAQGLNLDSGTSQTRNAVLRDGDGNPLPYAAASVIDNVYPQGLTMALAAPAMMGESAGGPARATFLPTGSVLRDAGQLLVGDVNDPGGARGDQLMALAFDVGDVDPGETVRLRYFVLFGQTPGQAEALYAQINDGTGRGHLAATDADGRLLSADEGLMVASGDPDDTAPTLPFRQYFAEGYTSFSTYTFVPILNPHAESTRVVLLARYEFEARDQVLLDVVMPPQSRDGVIVTSPDLFASGDSLTRPETPYALEVRAERPVAANFSHFDTFLLQGQGSALGESFGNRPSQTWLFGEAEKGPDTSEFVTFMNTSDEEIKVTATFLPSDGSAPISVAKTVEGLRRGGISLAAEAGLPEGRYGVLLEAQAPIVASISRYDRVGGSASAAAGTPGTGRTSGAIPEGQLGLNSGSERIGVANAQPVSTQVLFSFLFEDGSAFRQTLDVPARGRAELDVSTLKGFPQGQPYSVFFESGQPVAMTLPTAGFGDALETNFSDTAYTLWGFAEGYRPSNNDRSGQVESYLRVFNPSQESVLVEITLHFSGEQFGSDTFRRTVAPRAVAEFDIHEFVTGEKRDADVFYGMTVKAATPVVAYQGHFDNFFPGGFGTLGTPLGTTQGLG